jgi:serine/threonine-protein kinase
MLTGDVPFIGNDPTEVMNMHLYAAIPRLDKVKPTVSVQIATVVARCLQHDHEKRYEDVHGLIHDLQQLAQVDTTELEKLTLKPPKPSFFKTQVGQVLMLLMLTIAGMMVLTLIAVVLKR